MFNKILRQCPIIFTAILFVILSGFSQLTWPCATKFELLHSFGENEMVESPLIHDAFGNHYGIVSSSIYKITPTGQYKILYTFNKAYGRVAPKLILGKGSKFYGWTINTNPTYPKSNAVIFVLDLSQTTPVFKVLHKDTENKPFTDLILGRNGILYGGVEWKEWDGGVPHSFGSIFQLDVTKPSPIHRTIYTLTIGNHGVYFTNLIQGKGSLLYGVATTGGTAYGDLWQGIFALNNAKPVPVFSFLKGFGSSEFSHNYVNFSLGGNGIMYAVQNNTTYHNGTKYYSVEAFQADMSSTAPTFSQFFFYPRNYRYRNGKVIQGNDGKFYLVADTEVFHLDIKKTPIGFNHIYSAIEGGLAEVLNVTQGLDGRFYGFSDLSIFGTGASIYRIKPAQSCPPANTPPVAKNDSFALTFSNGQLSTTVASPGVLKNDNDADKNKITVADATASKSKVIQLAQNAGKIMLYPDGHFNYTLPYKGFSGSSSFNYRATDGKAFSNPATVTLTIRSNINK